MSDTAGEEAAGASRPSSREVVSVALKVGRRTELKKLWASQPLDATVAELCGEFGLDPNPRKYALRLVASEEDERRNRYLGEDSRGEIRDGCILSLVHSPEQEVKIILRRLVSKDERQWALERTSVYTCDPIFSKEFVSCGGLFVLCDLIADLSVPLEEIALCLGSVLDILTLKLAPSLSMGAITRMMSFATSENPLDSRVVEDSLAILRAIMVRKRVDDEESSLIEKNLSMSDLVHNVWNRDHPEIQRRALAVINALAEGENSKRILQSMASNKYRETVYRNVIQSSEVSESMAHELHVYQNLVLNLQEYKLNTIVDPSGEDHKKVLELKSIISRVEADLNSLAYREPESLSVPDVPQARYSCAPRVESDPKCIEAEGWPEKTFPRSMSTTNFEDYFSTSGLVPSSICKITLDFMLYFPKRYTKSFARLMLEETSLSHSFPATCDRLARLVCDVTGVGRAPRKDGSLFQPMVFAAKPGLHLLEELFCRSVPLLGRTRREMRARTVEDEDKVFPVLRRQLQQALRSRPQSLEKLDEALHDQSYHSVAAAWEQERADREQWVVARCPSVQELKASRRQDLLELVKEQRIGLLKDGADFPLYNSRGQREKKKLRHVYLTSNQKTLIYRDYDESSSSQGKLQKVQLTSVASLVTGKRCPHLREVRQRKMDTDLVELSFSLLLEEDPPSLDLVAPNRQTFDSWVDGLNALLGREMTSATMLADLEVLTDMEVRLLLLELQGMNIPFKPPPVPPPPLCYPFDDESAA
ncbi:engulfment and cell motility protein 2-like [Bacillus rossius redtenbacheri]|uniref:engulfment and cell motility protein 2-like n=1 Tax=Bacillus rossius redtenbacheri TaxID=93214 RepID=UPI002FDE546D